MIGAGIAHRSDADHALWLRSSPLIAGVLPPLSPLSLSLSAASLSHEVSGARALSLSVALPARDGAWGTEPAREWRLDRAEVVGESGGDVRGDKPGGGISLGDGDRELIEETEPCGGDRGSNGGNEESSGGGELDRLGDEVLDESLGDAGGDGEGRLWTTSL